MFYISLWFTYRLYLNYNANFTAERQVINYRQKFCNNVIVTQTFCLNSSWTEKSKELLKKRLIVRACLVAEFFLLKLNRPWPCASNLIISTKTWRKTTIDGYRKKSPPKNPPPDSKRNPICNLTLTLPPRGDFFPGGYFPDTHIDKYTRWWSHFFTKTQSYSLQNSTRRHHRCFHEDVLKYLHRTLWKISRKMYLI